MKKTITGIFWTLTLSLTPALSMENNKRTEEQKVLCNIQYWEGGKMLREEIRYTPEAHKSTPPSGRGAWEGPLDTHNSLPKSEQSSGGTWEESIIFNTPIQNPTPQKPAQRSGMGAWESMAMNHSIVQNTPTIIYHGTSSDW